MTLRALTWTLLLWAGLTGLACFGVSRAFTLRAAGASGRVVASVWSHGQIIARTVVTDAAEPAAALDAALASHPGATRVDESIVGEGPVVTWPIAALSLSLVPGRDGLKVTLDGRTEYLTPDELLARQAYDRGINVAALGLTAGLDAELALAILAERFGVPVTGLLDRAKVGRVRVLRSIPGASPPRVITAETMTDEDVRSGAIAAGRFLARGVDAEGRFRYLVDAPTNRTLSGYDWPRHSGATYFLAQTAALVDDAQVNWAALRAASQLRDHAMVECGNNRCIGSDRIVDVGSTALAVIAFAEIAKTKLDPAYALVVPGLTAFLRAQQRSDGEFMHQYDQGERRPIDVQFLYYSGEAALALSRAHSLLHDPADLDAASRALARLVGPGWTFFGSRYYFGEEHWTCQATDDLWDRAPNAQALDFCLRWQAFGRKLQYEAGETLFDAEGAYGLGPLLTPRLTPVGSRSEAGIATLDAARRAGSPASELSTLELQMRRSLALLLRHQFRPGLRHLLVEPDAVQGAMPASQVDWQLRIDFAQHTGSALVRWLGLRSPERGDEKKQR
ncbi:MAG TPA: hypothetical protein VGY54_20225 [Polyangiaceae bacterium]|nr:hypothetical protein [Polyangiaceae bacterium]